MMQWDNENPGLGNLAELQNLHNYLENMHTSYTETFHDLTKIRQKIGQAWQGIAAETWEKRLTYCITEIPKIQQIITTKCDALNQYCLDLEKIQNTFSNLQHIQFEINKLCFPLEDLTLLTPLIQKRHKIDQKLTQILQKNNELLQSIQFTKQNKTKLQQFTPTTILTNTKTNQQNRQLVNPNTLNSDQKNHYLQTTEGQLASLIYQDYPHPETKIDAIQKFFSTINEKTALELTFYHANNIGNLAGVPFKYRIIANKKNILTEKTKRENRLKQTKISLEKIQQSPHPKTLTTVQTEKKLLSEHDTHLKVLQNYEWVIQNKNNLITIDDTGDGKYIEMLGNLTNNIQHTYTLIPGTGASLQNIDTYHTRNQNIHNTTKNTKTVGFYWMGTDFPNKIFPNAISTKYAKAGATALKEFDYTLQKEIKNSKQKTTNTNICYSYGCSITGNAEKNYGYQPNKIIYVAPAGIGITSPKEANKNNIQRFWIQSPNDPITVSQYSTIHGGNPEFFQQITRLSSGFLDHQNPTKGKVSGHSQYFTENSTSLKNIGSVITNSKKIILH